ncbi:hypothetical protein BP6252_11074 [Coleophoma cylindrospora]|uniref:O-fucosyltransferase family protein n=1 Tax=Coleophoma cylindrospora TaxID=1849047 RepID=A0A3D8QP07_9HELO|nr:hypothetical protein BP6252_11074 [Coleophoma cylindrospora]
MILRTDSWLQNSRALSQRTLLAAAVVSAFIILSLITRLDRMRTSISVIWPAYSPALSKQQDEELRALCDKADWTPGLWIHCHSGAGPNGTAMNGGLNNARNRLQTCLRLAIDTGAGLIIGTTMTRDPKNLVNTSDLEVCPDTFFNVANMEIQLQQICPRLKLRHCSDLSGITTVLKPPHKPWQAPSFSTGQFKSWLQQYLDTATYRIDTSAISPSSPVAVDFADSYKGWNYRKSKELSTIRKSLFRTIEYNPKLLAIGEELQKSPQLKNGYIGIHLRGEVDWPAAFGGLQVQLQLYSTELVRIAAQNIQNPNFHKTVFVSCGSEEAIRVFREKIEPFGFEVHSKISLLRALDPDKATAVEALNFDSRAIVEYAVLVKADYFLGLIMSTFSSVIAFARTLSMEEDFFEDYVFPGSVRQPNSIQRHYTVSEMKGDNKTMLLVVNGDDVMDSFP